MYQLEPAFDAQDDLEDPELEHLVPGRRVPTARLRKAFGMPEVPRAADGQPSGAREVDLDDVPAVSFEQLLARGTIARVPRAVRAALEAAHGVDLGGVRLWHVPELAHHAMRGLSRGLDIAVADLADVETIEHELGHVLDSEVATEANAFVAGLHFAHDPGREARADRLGRAHRERGEGGGRGARGTTPAPIAAAWEPSAEALELAPVAPRRAPVAASHAAPQARVTAAPGFHPAGTQAAFTKDREPAAGSMRGGGGGYPAVRTHNPFGGGGGLTPAVVLAPPRHGQLDEVTAVIVPGLAAPGALPAAPRHPRGLRGAFVLPAALFGSACAENLIFLPDDAAATLAAWQARVTAFARRVPGRFHARTTFGQDGLADGLDLAYECLHPETGAATGTRLTWTPSFPIDRATWSAEARASSDDRTAPARAAVAPDAIADGLLAAAPTPRGAALVAAMTTAPALAASPRVAALAAQLARGVAPDDLASYRVTFADTLAALAALEPAVFAALAALVMA